MNKDLLFVCSMMYLQVQACNKNKFITTTLKKW